MFRVCGDVLILLNFLIGFFIPSGSHFPEAYRHLRSKIIKYFQHRC